MDNNRIDVDIENVKEKVGGNYWKGLLWGHRLFDEDINSVTNPSGWITGNIINWYLDYVVTQECEENMRTHTLVFHTRVFRQNQRFAYQNEFLGNHQAFTKKLWVIPYHSEGVHWGLIVVLYPRKADQAMIRILDSLSINREWENPGKIVQEWLLSYHNKEEPWFQPDVCSSPQQKDGFNCGLYTLLLARIILINGQFYE